MEEHSQQYYQHRLQLKYQFHHEKIRLDTKRINFQYKLKSS
jgi:hypothetical protein